MKQRYSFIFVGTDDGTSEKTLSTMTKEQKDCLAVQMASLWAVAFNKLLERQRDPQDDPHNVVSRIYVDSAEHLED